MGEALLKLKTDEKLLSVLTSIREPNTEERREQRVSFVYGSLGDKNTLTRDQVRELIEKNL